MTEGACLTIRSCLGSWLGMAALSLAAILATAEAATQPVRDPLILVRAAHVLAVPGERPLGASTVLVRRDRIIDVKPGLLDCASLSDEPSCSSIDLGESWILPGLGDGHVHLSFDRTAAPSASAFDRGGISRSTTSLDAWLNARKTLAAGFTTVRDLASNSESVFALRNAIEAGRLPGPRILVSGLPISSTGGHGDFTPPGTPHTGPDESGLCDGVEECRRAVREQIKRRADVIKIMATGGFASRSGTSQHFTEEEMRAAIEAAHLRGIKVTTHAYDPLGILAALRAGVDSVEHGIFVNNEGLALMKQRGVWLVPTLVTTGERGDYVARAHKAGVGIAFGTDSGMTPHGQNAREFPLLVAAGLTPTEALLTATRNFAAMTGLEKDIGTLEPGKLADLIAVGANPLDDIQVLQKVEFVMKSGRVFKRDGRIVAMD